MEWGRVEGAGCASGRRGVGRWRRCDAGLAVDPLIIVRHAAGLDECGAERAVLRSGDGPADGRLGGDVAASGLGADDGVAEAFRLAPALEAAVDPAPAAAVRHGDRRGQRRGRGGLRQSCSCRAGPPARDRDLAFGCAHAVVRVRSDRDRGDRRRVGPSRLDVVHDPAAWATDSVVEPGGDRVRRDHHAGERHDQEERPEERLLAGGHPRLGRWRGFGRAVPATRPVVASRFRWSGHLGRLCHEGRRRRGHVATWERAERSRSVLLLGALGEDGGGGHDCWTAGHHRFRSSMSSGGGGAKVRHRRRRNRGRGRRQRRRPRSGCRGHAREPSLLGRGRQGRDACSDGAVWRCRVWDARAIGQRCFSVIIIHRTFSLGCRWALGF